jgi:fructoselysine 6-kinase
VDSVLAVGDNVVDCYQHLGEIFPGGNCVNVSVFARRAGARSGYLGAVGADAAGGVLRAALLQEGVDIERLRVVDGITASCLIGLDEGERVFLGQHLGTSRFVPVNADYDYASCFQAVHIGQSSGLDEYLEPFSRVAALSYDFSQRFDAARVAEVAPLCHLASFSAAGLGEAEARALAESAVQAGAAWSLATLGGRGSVLAHQSGVYRSEAVQADVVDTLGAGDTFIARVLVGTLRGEEPNRFLTSAARMAAETCSRHGAFGYGESRLEEVLRPPAYALWPAGGGPDPDLGVRIGS